MTLIRRNGESQRAFVERVLREDGRISAYDALYASWYDDGRPTSLTRLAAVIHTLRSEGWEIDAHADRGRLAEYRLRQAPAPDGWRCAVCKSTPATPPVEVLGGMAQAHCGTCAARRFFRRPAAA
jgi:hypothetical protein